MRKLLNVLIGGLVLMSIFGCGSEEANTEIKSDKTSNYFTEVIFTTVDNDYVYEGTPTKAPYTVFNQDHTLVKEYSLMTDAIRNAGDGSTNSNKMYVKDANGLVIYERTSKSNYYCYDGINYVGIKPRNEAIKWSKQKAKSYIIDGFATAYQACGTHYYDGTDFMQNIPLELNAGAYNYMFSNTGVLNGSDFVENGYGYMECKVLLSQATYKPTQDDGTWNAYIFLHGKNKEYADFGIKGVIEDGEMVWKLFKLCSHSSHVGKDKWFEDDASNAVTKMKYNAEKDYYEGTDDLFMQLYQGVNGWKLVVTNLTTNKVSEISEYHEGMMEGQQGYFQMLLAASYCPAVMNIWNNRCGAFLRNVCYTDVKIARYNSNEAYDSSMLVDFYPDSNMFYGFTQAADASSMIYGINHEGKKMLSFSTYYDGGGHFE